MKRNLILVGLALGAAVTLAGCSQSSPTAPKQPTPSTYGITLTVSPSVAGINEAITAVALVTVGGANAPDGTKVTFTAAGSASFSPTALVQQGFATTSSGGVAIQVYASGGGVGTVTATVPNKSATATVHFTGVSPSQLAITSILPNRGKPQGGDQVVISGQGFTQPLVLSFVIGGTAYPATVVSVANDGSSITALTPQVPSSSGDQLAGVRVVVGSGAGAITANLANAFTFGADTGVPQLYSVTPNSGSSNGGDIVTLTGKYFTEPLQVSFVFAAATVAGQVTSVQHGADGVDVAQVVTPKVTIAGRTTVNITITNMAGSASSKSATFNQVFTFNPPVTGPPTIYYISPAFGSVAGNDTVTIFGTNFAAPASVSIGPTSEIVQSISTDGTMITILTRPVAGAVPTTAQDVTVTTAQAPPAVLPAAFTYIEGQTPQLYVLTPNIGPLEGGTRVTITGTGFQYPVQVLFGTQQAQVVSNNFNQVVCISPSITPTQPNTPTTVQVSVTNVGSGKVSNTLPFQYGQAMFISGITPSQGPATGGTSVTITGQGFVSPVSVIWGGSTAWTVLSVAGTQVVAQSAALPLTQQCSGGSGTLKVTNLDSGLNATSPDGFTYQGVNPLITSIVVSNCGAGSGNTVPGNQSPCTLTVKGSNFGSNMQLSLANPITTIPENAGGTSTQAVFTLTNSLESLGIKYNTAACTNGTQNLITPIDVKITDSANSCTNTLAGGLLVSPSNTTCQVNTPLTMTLAPATASITGGTSITYAVNFSRPAQASDGANLTVVISPSGSGVIASATSLTVPIAVGQQTATFNVQAGLNAGTATISATYAGVSATANLTVTASTNGIIFTPGAVNLAPGQGSTIGISINPAAATATTVTVTLTGPSGVVVSPVFPQTVNVPAGGSGTLSITAGTTAGTVTLTGSSGALTPGTATVTVTAPAVALTITPASQTLLPAQSASLNVTITPPPSAPATVTLTLAGPSGILTSPVFPASITVPISGTATVPITAGSTNGTVNINGSYGTATASATVTVQTTPLTLTLAPGNQTLAVGGTANFIASINQAQSVPVTVYITQNGPTGIISFGPEVTGSPASVTIPANQSFTNFTVNGLNVGGPVTITGTLPPAYGSGTATSSVTVNAFTITLSPNPMSLGVGVPTNMTVTLNNPAPATTSVTLTSAAPGIASVTSPVVFAAGSTTATAVVTGVAPGTTTITAGPVPSLGGAQGTATVTVTPYTFTLNPNPMTLAPGATLTLTATLNNPAASGHTTQLVIGAVPASIAILGTNTLIFPPGTSTATTVVTAVGPGTATVAANLQIDAVTVSTSNWTVTTLSTLTMTANPSTIAAWVGGQFNVQLTLSAPAPAALTVPLAITGPTNVITLSVPSVTFAAGANTAQFAINANSVSPNGTPNIVVATLPGQYGGGQATVTVTVALPLTFTPAAVTTTVGSPVQVIVTMAAAQPLATPVTLTWAGTLPAPAFPGSVLIPANTTFATFTIPAAAAATGSITGTLPPSLPQGLGGATANLPVTIQ